MSRDARTVAVSTGSPTSASKAKSSKSMAACLTRITSASAGLWVSISPRRGRWAIAASPVKCPRPSSVCSVDISPIASRARIYAVFSRGTATRNCGNFWPEKTFRRWGVISLLHKRWSRQQEVSVTSLFPMFIKLEGKQVLVVGAGKVGESKIEGLLETGARIRVVAREATPAVREWARNGKVELEVRPYFPADLDGAFLAVIATSSRTLNERIYHEAQQRRVLCNVVDVPDLCDFYYSSLVRRGDLQIAVSTAGQSPSLAQKIRHQLEKQFGPGYASWVAELGETRKLILASELDRERKLELLHSLVSREAAEKALAEHQELTAELTTQGDRV